MFHSLPHIPRTPCICPTLVKPQTCMETRKPSIEVERAAASLPTTSLHCVNKINIGHGLDKMWTFWGHSVIVVVVSNK